MYVAKFNQTEVEERPECKCYHILPKEIIANLEAGVVITDPGGVSLSEAHTEWRQVFFMLEGRGTLILNQEEEIRVEPNMVIEIPYNKVHKIKADEGVSIRYLYVNDYSKPLRP